MKTKLLSVALALGLTGLIGFPTPELLAQRDGRLWSIAVHFRYIDGFEYDYVIARGVPTREISSYLAECGASHSTGSVVWYHCYPIPE
jgi:hypothetical protein